MWRRTSEKCGPVVMVSVSLLQLYLVLPLHATYESNSIHKTDPGTTDVAFNEPESSPENSPESDSTGNSSEDTSSSEDSSEGDAIDDSSSSDCACRIITNEGGFLGATICVPCPHERSLHWDLEEKGWLAESRVSQAFSSSRYQIEVPFSGVLVRSPRTALLNYRTWSFLLLITPHQIMHTQSAVNFYAVTPGSDYGRHFRNTVLP